MFEEYTRVSGKRAASALAYPIRCTVVPANRRVSFPRLLLLFAPSALETLRWLLPGAAVRVERGLGPDRGVLRLTPASGAPHTVGMMPGQTKHGGATLILPAVASCPAALKLTQLPCEWDDNDTVTPPWLSVTIPAAARVALWEPGAVAGAPPAGGARSSQTASRPVGGIGPIVDAEVARRAAR